MRTLAERERHTLGANLIGLLGCLFAVLQMGELAVFALPLGLRLVAIFATRLATNNLRKVLQAGGPLTVPLRWVGTSLTIAGFTWGLLMHHALAHVAGHTFAFVIIGIAIVGVSLIAAMVGPLPKILASFVGTFALTLFGALALRPEGFDPAILLAATAMLGGVVAYSLGVARQSQDMSLALIENRELGIELADALAHAEFLSQRDPLTGLRNRRAFMDDPRFCDANPRDRHVIALDLDRFKAVNDTFGHAMGDRVLALTGDAIRDVLRPLPDDSHCAVRLGGEEFAIVIDRPEEALAASVADDLLAAIAAITTQIDADGLAVSASIGRARWRSGENLSQALQAADEALYRAKETGRNRIVAMQAG